MEYLDKGVHFGDAVAFCLMQRNDGSWSGDIRVTDAAGAAGIGKNLQAYSVMTDTRQTGDTREAVIGKLDADLAALIKEASA